MKKDYSYGGVILKEGKILIIKHTNGHYGLPKGHKENNETDLQAAVREIKGEVNLEVELISDKFIFENYIINNEIDKEVKYYFFKPITNDIKVQEEEVSEYLYIKIEDIANYSNYPETKKLIKDILNVVEEL